MITANPKCVDRFAIDESNEGKHHKALHDRIDRIEKLLRKARLCVEETGLNKDLLPEIDLELKIKK